MTGRNVQRTIEHFLAHQAAGDVDCDCRQDDLVEQLAAYVPPPPPKRANRWRCAARPEWAAVELERPDDGGAVVVVTYGGVKRLAVALDEPARLELVSLACEIERALAELLARGPDPRGPFEQYHHPDVVALVKPAKGTVRGPGGWFVSAHVQQLRGDWVCNVFISAVGGTYSVYFRPTQWSEFLHELGRGLDVTS